MTRIGIRELRQHASRYLEKVKAGEVVEVTERGELIALLVAPTPATSARDKLIVAGQLTPSTSDFYFPERRKIASSRQSATEVLADLRSDR